MKFRVQGNSIRFRLNRREVAQFSQAGRMSTSVQFGSGALAYTLARSASIGSIDADFTGSEILVRVPDSVAKDWAEGETVSLRGEQPLPGGARLEITVEKDFQCLHKGEEGKDPDAYPNPAAAD
jgi:hypothetical protein